MDTELHWDPIIDDAWRVSDPGRPPNDADAAIAYVERHPDGSCEVVWLCGSTGVQTFPTLDAAAVAVRRRHRESRVSGAPTARKPIPIAHRPPMVV